MLVEERVVQRETEAVELGFETRHWREDARWSKMDVAHLSFTSALIYPPLLLLVTGKHTK